MICVRRSYFVRSWVYHRNISQYQYDSLSHCRQCAGIFVRKYFRNITKPQNSKYIPKIVVSKDIFSARKNIRSARRSMNVSFTVLIYSMSTNIRYKYRKCITMSFSSVSVCTVNISGIICNRNWVKFFYEEKFLFPQ